MDLLNDILNSPEVRMAAGAVVTAALGLVAAYLRALAVRLAARAGAMHAESMGRETGARGQEKMRLATEHAEGLLPRLVRPRRSRTQELIEDAVPKARESFISPPPPDES